LLQWRTDKFHTVASLVSYCFHKSVFFLSVTFSLFLRCKMHIHITYIPESCASAFNTVWFNFHLDIQLEAISSMSSYANDTTPLLRDDSQSNVHISMTEVTTKSSPTYANNSATSNNSKERVTSLDQYRGFVILCSLIVPLLGQLKAASNIFKHTRNFFNFAGT
jgi:hypothetical protein